LAGRAPRANTAYVTTAAMRVLLDGYTVGLINLRTRHVFPPITVCAFPAAIAITA
jgi:hypothetical protein